MSIPPTRIVLVRHGESIWHAENRYAGRTDIGLTPNGDAQAASLALWARTAGLAAVYSSTLSRAIATATPVAEACDLRLQTMTDLMELDFGRGEGLSDREMGERFPAARAAFKMDPVKHHLPEGEDPMLAVERGMRALRQIAAKHRGQRVLVVAHSTLMRLLLCDMLQISHSNYRSVFPRMANGTLTEIEMRTSGIALLSFNSPLAKELTQ
jgi:probable phosphoglycerate mutase